MVKRLIIGIITIVVIAGIVLFIDFSENNEMPSSETQTPPVSENENAGSTDTHPSGESRIPKTYNVEIRDFAYSPSSLLIQPGDTVIWKNKDSVGHTVTSDSGDELDSSLLGNGDSYSYKFTTIGNYAYHCTPHPYMKGTVIVE